MGGWALPKLFARRTKEMGKKLLLVNKPLIVLSLAEVNEKDKIGWEVVLGFLPTMNRMQTRGQRGLTNGGGI